jgi:transposase InsO family protein
VKFISLLPGSRRKYYQFTAIDDCTRLRVLRIYDRLNQKTAVQFLDYVVAKLPFRVECIQTDNGPEFQSAFHYHVLDRGIGHVYIRPATPRLNGKVERFHRIDAEEFYRMLDGVVIDDAGVFKRARRFRERPTVLLGLEDSRRDARCTRFLWTARGGEPELAQLADVQRCGNRPHGESQPEAAI